MARVRYLNPGFFLDDALADLDFACRLLFAGLWCVADREGRLKDNPRRIKAEILPYDDCTVDTMLQSLHEHGFIYRYEADGVKCIGIPAWKCYQNPHYREPESVLPPCLEQGWLNVASTKGQGCANHGSTLNAGTGTGTGTGMDASPKKDLCPKCRKGHHDIELSYDEDGKLHCALCGYKKRAGA